MSKTKKVSKEYNEQTNLILKAIQDQLSGLDQDLATVLVCSAIKLNSIHLADILDATIEAQKRRHLIQLMKTTDKTEIFDTALKNCKLYGYTY